MKEGGVKMYIELLKEGLRLYKYKNSQLKPIDYVETQKKGAVFIYYSKAALIAAHGLVVTSVEAIEGQQHQITHSFQLHIGCSLT